MSFIRSVGRAARQAAYLPWDDFWYETPGRSTAAGIKVSRERVLGIPAMYQGIRLISENTASLPMGMFFKETPTSLAVEGELPIWIRRPNPEVDTRVELVQQIVTSLLIDSNSYNRIMRDRRGNAAELWTWDFNDVQIERDPERGIIYKLGGDEIPTRDIIHIRGLTLPGGVKGLSPVDACAESLGISLAVERYAASYFGQGAMGQHVLTTATGNDEQVKALEAKLNDQWGGLGNAWKLRVLGQAADTKIHNLTMPNDASQMLETRVHQVIEVARVLNVPPHLLFEMTKETTWGSGIEQQGIGFVVYTLRPWLERLEQKLNLVISREMGQRLFVKWNVNGLLRGDVASRYAAYRTAHDGGWMNADEIRELEDQPPIPNGRGQWYVTQP